MRIKLQENFNFFHFTQEHVRVKEKVFVFEKRSVYKASIKAYREHTKLEKLHADQLDYNSKTRPHMKSEDFSRFFI